MAAILWIENLLAKFNNKVIHSFRSKDQVSTISVDNKCKPNKKEALYFANGFLKKNEVFLLNLSAYFLAPSATRVAEK